MVEDISELLNQIQSRIENKKPASLAEALEYEAENLYIYHALRIAKGKLVNDLRKEDINAMKNLRKYFEMARENRNRVDSQEDKEIIRKLYR